MASENPCAVELYYDVTSNRLLKDKKFLVSESIESECRYRI